MDKVPDMGLVIRIEPEKFFQAVVDQFLTVEPKIVVYPPAQAPGIPSLAIIQRDPVVDRLLYHHNFLVTENLQHPKAFYGK